MMWTKKLKVGDTIFCRSKHNRPQERTLVVTKIGRKYIYAAATGSNNADCVIDIETGTATHGYYNVYESQESYQALVDHADLASKISGALDFYHARLVPTEKLKQIAEILWGLS